MACRTMARLLNYIFLLQPITMTINTVIIEDEEKCVSVLQSLISRFAPELRVCGHAGDVDGAVRLIESLRPRIVFIDIRIADGTGFDVLKKLAWHGFELIFVTAYDNYALEAFQHAAVHYLLKPIGTVDFEQAVERLRKKLPGQLQQNAIELLMEKLAPIHQQNKKISVPTLLGCDFIDPKDILWCRSEGACTTFYLSDHTKVKTQRNLGSFEKVLYDNNFFRIH